VVALAVMSNFGPPARNSMWRVTTMPDDRHEPYDVGQPFDADELMGGFTEEVHEHRVDPASTLGRAMAEAREAWAQPGYVPLDPETFTVEPIPVELDDE
jgi:hypothetical protein